MQKKGYFMGLRRNKFCHFLEERKLSSAIPFPAHKPLCLCPPVTWVFPVIPITCSHHYLAELSQQVFQKPVLFWLTEVVRRGDEMVAEPPHYLTTLDPGVPALDQIREWGCVGVGR